MMCDLKPIEKYLQKISFNCRDLMLKMLSVNPENRPTPAEALEHPWFQENQ